MRTAHVKRSTTETEIEVELNLDGRGTNAISTPIKFFDHMLATFARHGFFDLRVNAGGDLSHHVVEDTGIALGEAFKIGLDAGGAKGRERTVRFGYASVPMDESIAHCAVDIGGIGGEGRSFTVIEVDFAKEQVENFSTENLAHFISSFAAHAHFTIHISAKGENEHHKVEAIFKALAVALDKATRIEERRKGEGVTT
ncbi:MAG: imidazoleglycerol-phosphate dehydratase [Methanophagales archaeon ANME-1-THS]|nr:MAG: imidazoleglycerol-phosphate dehydratase [Methanophagales archaeon ANME-1-THS]